MSLNPYAQQKYTLTEIQKMLDKDNGTILFWAKGRQIKAAQMVLKSREVFNVSSRPSRAILKIYALLMELQDKTHAQYILGGKGDMAEAYLLKIQDMIDEGRKGRGDNDDKKESDKQNKEKSESQAE